MIWGPISLFLSLTPSAACINSSWNGELAGIPSVMEAEGRSLTQTPTYAVATVTSVMVSLGFLFHTSLKWTGKWLDRTKRKSLLAALEKVKQELMLFGLLSLLMGHWIEFIAKICVKSSSMSSRFYPCAREADFESSMELLHAPTSFFMNNSIPREHVVIGKHNYCPAGHESFVSYESLEQLHRFLFVLATIHVSYSFATIALAMIKIYSWIKWEHQAKTMAVCGSQRFLPTEAPSSGHIRIMRFSTFVFHHAAHPWSQHRVLVWMLCFSRQFWSSINRNDYMALRLGFIATHELPLSYDFHNYMLRSMEEEFRDIVGISVPLWVYAIFCIFLDFHGSNIYFWISFLPSILILLVGTKLHLIIVKLAVEIVDSNPTEQRKFNLRDDLFWFRKPRLLLWLIQFVSFQNAFEMATFIWSLWEINETSCFMDNNRFLVIRLTFGVVSQFWCSFVTFPLYVIVTQMGSRFKKTVVSESVRRSLHGWHLRAKAKHPGSTPLLSTTMSVTSLDSLMTDDIDTEERLDTMEGSTSDVEEEDISIMNQEIFELPPEDADDVLNLNVHSGSSFDSVEEDDS